VSALYLCYDDCTANIFTIILVAVDFPLSTVTASAERVGVSIPSARVTWSTSVPPECVESVRIKFRTVSSGTILDLHS